MIYVYIYIYIWMGEHSWERMTSFPCDVLWRNLMEAEEYHYCHMHMTMVIFLSSHQIPYGEWPSHNTCFLLGPHDVCATWTTFSPTCIDSETSPVLVDKIENGTYKIFCTGDFTHTTAPLSLCSITWSAKPWWIAFCHKRDSLALIMYKSLSKLLGGSDWHWLSQAEVCKLGYFPLLLNP